MVKRENAITVDIVKAIVIRNYIKFGEHVKKIEMKIFMAGSTWLRYFAASTQGKHGSTRLKHFTAQLLRLQLRLPGPFVPWPVHSLELSFQVPGPFLPRTIRSFVSRAVPGPLTKKEQCLYFTEFFRTIDILLLFIFHSRPSTFALKIIILRTQ